jgi:hypothetical protein
MGRIGVGNGVDGVERCGNVVVKEPTLISNSYRQQDDYKKRSSEELTMMTWNMVHSRVFPYSRHSRLGRYTRYGY